MTASLPSTKSALPAQTSSFTDVQKEYLSGMLSGLAARQASPFAGIAGGQFTSDSAAGGANLAAEQEEPSFHGTAISELCRQEFWKYTAS